MALNMGTPGSASMEQNKDLLLDTLDKIYGENSNQPFLRYSHKEINRQRRVRFLRQLPELIRDRYLGCNLFDADSFPDWKDISIPYSDGKMRKSKFHSGKHTPAFTEGD